ncbi:MAG: four helix bundle protein [Nanoarchaeota archaeon]|nr:four helix bundle protein [Nanoarchaeota archaeon]
MSDGYKRLEVWKIAIRLSEDVKREIGKFPKIEARRLIDQLLGSSISVFSNIVEGYKGGTKKEFLRYLKIAYGSLNELASQLLYSNKVGYSNDEDYKKLRNIVFKLDRKMAGFIKFLERDDKEFYFK